MDIAGITIESGVIKNNPTAFVDIIVDSDVVVTGDLNVSGAASITGDLSVSGTASINGFYSISEVNAISGEIVGQIPFVDDKTIQNVSGELSTKKYIAKINRNEWPSAVNGHSTYVISGNVHNQGEDPVLFTYIAMSGEVELQTHSGVVDYELLTTDRVRVSSPEGDISIRVVNSGTINDTFSAKFVVL